MNAAEVAQPTLNIALLDEEAPVAWVRTACDGGAHPLYGAMQPSIEDA
jgi:hypothetical protein